jgi:nucleoside-diphosphate kinase
LATEQTLIIIKPDAFKRGLTGEILARFEKKGLAIKDLKTFRFSRERAEEFYDDYRDKPFFQELVSFMSSGPVVACILEGGSAIMTSRIMIGSTKAYEAQGGTIRGDYGLGLVDNVIHASHSTDHFLKESKIIFSSNSMMGRERSAEVVLQT